MNKINARKSKDNSYFSYKKHIGQWVFAYLSRRYVSYSMDGWWFEELLEYIHLQDRLQMNITLRQKDKPSIWVFFSFFEMGMKWINVDDCRQQYFIWIGFVELIASAQYLDMIWSVYFWWHSIQSWLIINIILWWRTSEVRFCDVSKRIGKV